ncbi:hypothetical protein ACH5RR_011068 [Cinchona calisaya]|uniref:PWWP domain-containing protein n=1 Tax=Cinchona calisaya TaxID=153742 RepID=A0ABD3A7G1_9GENT
MATREKTSRLRTLADVIGEPALTEPLGSGHGAVEKVGDVEAGIVSGEGKSKGDGDKITEGLNDEGGNIKEMDGEKGDGDDVESVEEHGYSVGDLVWGKIKSHPWWPGQIYDPKDASEKAVKFNQKGRLLVAYFGDGSFAWCLPSQLMPFAEHFEDMSKQSSSNSFVNAVQEAVDEIARLVELEMTCKCVPEENRKRLDSPPATNTGIKAGVPVPEGDIGKLLSFRYDSAELLSTVESIAVSVAFPSVLELAILRSWLAAFYCARGSYFLPIYHEGLQIEGLEDMNKNGPKDANDFRAPVEVPIQGPVEEVWPESGSAPSEDKIYHRRKQKSVSELMVEGTDKKSRSRSRSVAREGTNDSQSAKQKRKVDDEARNQSGSIHASATVRKRGRKKSDEISKEEMHKKSLSIEVEKHETVVADDNNGGGTKGTGDISSPRERKKSKYLSPPYTSPRFGAGNPFSKTDSEKESVKISKIARTGEPMTKAAGILLGSPPLVKFNGQTMEKKLPEGSNDGQLDISCYLNPPGSKQDQKIIEERDVNAPVNEVLTGVISMAINPSNSWNDRLLDLTRGFIGAFRGSVYLNGANYKIYHKRQPGRKRKSLSSEQENLGQGDAKSSEAKAHRIVGRKSTKDMPDASKQKKTDRGPIAKSNDKLVDASSASLVVTFAPGFSLPSKGDIIRTFRKFGVLNEKETVVFHDSASLQIVYTSFSGAEEALRASLRRSLFGSASVNYKLCYPSAPPAAVESSHITSSPHTKTSEKPVASGSTSDEKSQLGSIREKLEIMASMLEKYDGKVSTEEVSKLDSEIKPLFERVRKIAESAHIR